MSHFVEKLSPFRGLSFALLLAAGATTTAVAQELPEQVVFAGKSGEGNAWTPVAAPTIGADGAFYGTSVGYGDRNGAVYRLSCDGTKFEVILPFTASEELWGGVIEGKSGDLYGNVRKAAAPNAMGFVYRLAKTGKLTQLHGFTGLDGDQPVAPPLEAPDGTLYGVTWQGGADSVSGAGFGTVYKIDPAGVFSTLYDFGIDDGMVSGANPNSRLVRAADGTLYGTTATRGANNGGTVFKLDPQGKFSVLYAFGGTNGENPYDLLIGKDGNLYGRAFGGNGLVFSLTPAGAFSIVHKMAGTEGDFEYSPSNRPALSTDGSLVQGADDKLYGISYYGGANNYGTVFELTLEGQLKVLYTFKGMTDGANPRSLVQGRDKNLLGGFERGNTGIFKVVMPFADPAGCPTAPPAVNPDAGVATADDAGTLPGTDASVPPTSADAAVSNDAGNAITSADASVVSPSDAGTSAPPAPSDASTSEGSSSNVDKDKGTSSCALAANGDLDGALTLLGLLSMVFVRRRRR